MEQKLDKSQDKKQTQGDGTVDEKYFKYINLNCWWWDEGIESQKSIFLWDLGPE